MAGRKGTSIGRLVSLLVGAAVFAAVLGAAGVARAEDDIYALLDKLDEIYSGPVVKEVCTIQCHANIAETKALEIRFDAGHGYHLRYDCSACHPKFPHDRNGTEKPAMAKCFNCHGLRHGPSGLIGSGKCEDCHRTPRAELRPKFHTSDWAYTPHVAPSNKELNTRCAMCHTKASCDECHLQQGISWTPAKPMRFDPGEGCLEACHGQTTLILKERGKDKSFQVSGLDDSAHRGVSCVECHPDFRFQEGKDATKMWDVNAGLACQTCHNGSVEGAVAVAATYTASVHGQAIMKGNYDSATCSSCHGGHYIKVTTDDVFAAAELQASAFRVCARCKQQHGDEYETYDDYYHGAAYKKGAPDAPACWKCHGSHEIRSAADPASLVHRKNVAKTCESCHKGSRDSFARDAGSLIHRKAEAREDNPFRKILARFGFAD